ncbi:hypothetical protein BHM03_00024629 [Ensete ventricosum]|nr:hypothetical protein BHM03_00024629 [Ensete ventricosum]
MRAKKGSTLVFWSVFFFLWTIVTATLSPKGVNFEAYLVDPHGVLENWDQDSVDPCSWTMVTCSPENLVIGLDVKAANILLDDHCEAVVGDFGLAKLLDHRDSHVTTAVRGTVGHIAPEYLSTGQSSEKTDVYGFGILLLELITGLRAVEFGKASNQKGHRPKMSEVVSMLEGDGLAERWEASQRMEAHKLKVPETFSARYSDDISDDSSLLAQAVELSGPR